MSSTLPAPPSPLAPPPNIFQLEAGTLLDRVFNPTFAANGFNPGRGDPTRFAPIASSGGAVVPTLYAGGTRECAFHERIFHDVPLEGLMRTVDFKTIAPLAYCKLKVTRPLNLAMLFAPDLPLWEISRAQLIESLASYYPQTARWAESIHRHFPAVDGLIWSSRLCEPHPSYMFFGDRVTTADIEIAGPTRLIRKDAELIRDLIRFARRTGIAILNPPIPMIV